MRGRVEVRLELDAPMRAGEERTIRYTVHHADSRPSTPADQWHRHNGTAMHRLIAITVSLPTPGGRVTWSTVRHGTDRPEDVRREVLRGRTGRRSWPYPGEVGCQVGWELSA